ncbi:hypothetical protein [Aeromonas salmonicida]|uniref:hypothetical protein n=1 Tax=Aeromonas salmonicida TaxID=645 RepID=UPI003D70EB46
MICWLIWATTPVQTHKRTPINDQFVDLGQIFRQSLFFPPIRLDNMLQLATSSAKGVSILLPEITAQIYRLELHTGNSILRQNNF